MQPGASGFGDARLSNEAELGAERDACLRQMPLGIAGTCSDTTLPISGTAATSPPTGRRSVRLAEYSPFPH